jgi:hypothetical protein
MRKLNYHLLYENSCFGCNAKVAAFVFPSSSPPGILFNMHSLALQPKSVKKVVFLFRCKHRPVQSNDFAVCDQRKKD